MGNWLIRGKGGCTFMYISRAKRERDGGWRRRIPWIRSRLDTIRRSFWPSGRVKLVDR